MASTFGNRISELRDLLAQLPAAANERINQNLIDCIGRYADMRQTAMNDLLDYLEKASSSNLGTQSKWQARTSRLRSDMNALFADSVRDLMLPPAHQLFWSTALQAEDKFFDALSRVETPQLVDNLLTNQDNLSKLIFALQDTWTFLLSKNQGLQNDEMRAVQDMDAMVQSILSEMDTAGRAAFDNLARAAEGLKRSADSFKEKIKERLGRVADAIEVVVEVGKQLVLDEIKPDGFPDEANEPMEAVFKHTEMMVQAAAERARTYRTLLGTYRDLVSLQKGSVLTLFNKTRDDISRYLNDNGVNKAKVFLDRAKGQLNDWTSNQTTSRQRDDAAIFQEEANKVIDGIWKITEELDSKFREKFQGAFLSPLSNETIEALAQRYLFREQFRRMNDRDVQRKMEEYLKTFPEKMKQIEESVRLREEPIDTLPSEVRDLARSRNRDFQSYVHDRIKRQMELLLPAIDDLKKLLTPSNLEADFSRQELEDMLR